MFTCAVPLVPCSASTSRTFLYDSVSPLTNPTSGMPNKFVILTNGNCSNLVVLPLSVRKSLAFSKSINCVPIFLTSKPLTYALPAPIPIANKSSLVRFPSEVKPSVRYIPLFVPLSRDSLTSMSKGITE